ncbi:unnamed protein product [Ectocarpus sp. CCAP 1310/34]|nr:unnamed protein product [Ectocarpus sp. CCAP 1310/34]
MVEALGGSRPGVDSPATIFLEEEAIVYVQFLRTHHLDLPHTPGSEMEPTP